MLTSLSGCRGIDLPFRAWLFRIAHNLLVDHYRRECAHTTLSLKETQNVSGEDDTVLVGNPQIGDKVAFRGRIVADGPPILNLVVLVTTRIDLDDDDDDDLGCWSYSTAVRQTASNQIILQDWSGIG